MIEADPVAAAVRAVMTSRTEWTGTASELLGALAEMAGERVAKAKTWPDSPRALAGRLRRAATFLRKIGIDIGFEREGRARTRTIRITTTGKPASPETEGATVRIVRTVLVRRKSISSTASERPAADGRRSRTVQRRRRSNRPRQPMKTNDETDADGADGNLSPQSTRKKLAGAREYERRSSLEGGPRRRCPARDRWRGSHARGGRRPAAQHDGSPNVSQGRRDRASAHVARQLVGRGLARLLRRTGGIAEFDGGLPREQAEARAFACCVAEWLNRNPVRSSPYRCLGCGEAGQGHDPLLPFGAETPAMPGCILAARRIGPPPDTPRPSPP